jgi:hypothetical protein
LTQPPRQHVVVRGESLIGVADRVEGVRPTPKGGDTSSAAASSSRGVSFRQFAGLCPRCVASGYVRYWGLTSNLQLVWPIGSCPLVSSHVLPSVVVPAFINIVIVMVSQMSIVIQVVVVKAVVIPVVIVESVVVSVSDVPTVHVAIIYIGNTVPVVVELVERIVLWPGEAPIIVDYDHSKVDCRSALGDEHVVVLTELAGKHHVPGEVHLRVTMKVSESEHVPVVRRKKEGKPPAIWAHSPHKREQLT